MFGVPDCTSFFSLWEIIFNNVLAFPSSFPPKNSVFISGVLTSSVMGVGKILLSFQGLHNIGILLANTQVCDMLGLVN